MDTERLFVYGTLLPGLEPPYLRQLVRSLGDGIEATIAGALLDLGRYPGAILEPSHLIKPAASTPQRLHLESAWRRACTVMPAVNENSRIRGLLFDLPTDPSVLRAFDQYEGCDEVRELAEFVRVLGTATLEDDSTVTTWIYGLSSLPTRARVIPGGDYRLR